MFGTQISAVGLLIRFFLGGGAVALAYVLSKIFGSRWGGIFAAFPAVYIAAIVTVVLGVSTQSATPLALQISRGALVGMISNIAAAVTAFLLIKNSGWKRGLAWALGVWLLCVGTIYFTVISTGLMG